MILIKLIGNRFCDLCILVSKQESFSKLTGHFVVWSMYRTLHCRLCSEYGIWNVKSREIKFTSFNTCLACKSAWTRRHTERRDIIGATGNKNAILVSTYRMIFRDQAFSQSHDLAPRPPPPTTGDAQEGWKRKSTCWQKRWGSGWGRSRIIRPKESLVLYKSQYSLLHLVSKQFLCCFSRTAGCWAGSRGGERGARNISPWTQAS